MKYGFTVYQTEVEGRKLWFAESTDLEFCAGQGETCDEAVKSLEENEIVWLRVANEYGDDVPVQSIHQNAQYSGKFTVRISKTLHKKLSERAKDEDVSINSLVSEAIAVYLTAPSKQDKRIASEFLHELSSVLRDASGFIKSVNSFVASAFVNQPFSTSNSSYWENKPLLTVLNGGLQ